MRLPVVSRGSLEATETMLAEMRQINAALQQRYDTLLASYLTLKQGGYQEVTPLDPNERYVVVSIEDADAEAAQREAMMDDVERAD